MLAPALILAFSGAARAQAVSATEAQNAFTLYSQHQYASAAAAFESIIRRQPSARYCYYAAMAQRGNGKELRARQLFQYVVTNYPKSQEAEYAKQSLSVISAPAVAGTGASNSNDLPESVKKLIPADMQKLLETSMGKEAVKQVMAQQADQIDTIRKAERAGVMKQDKLAAAAESAGLMTARAEFKEHPFTAADVAKKGAHAIDQTRYPNCWFESSMAALAELPRGQKLIADMIRMKSKDTYVVRFPGDGVEYTVTSTDLMKSTVQDSATWASLLECAQTRKFPNNQGADGPEGDQNRLEMGMRCITGQKAEIMYLPKNSSVQEVSAFIGGAVKSQNPIVCGTYPVFPGLPELVVERHAYTITGFDPATNLITLRNPWGHNPEYMDLENDPQHLQFQQLGDGVFKMSIPLFQKYFNCVARSFI
jgi:hypothetical protein